MPFDSGPREQALLEEKKNLLLTPCVGTPVQWFQAGGDEPQAAIVTKVEAPGRVSLTVFGPNSPMRTLQGVIWKQSPTFRRDTPTVVRNGAYDLPAHVSPPKAFYTLHQEHIERQLEAVRKHKEEFDRNEANRIKQREEERKAAAAVA